MALYRHSSGGWEQLPVGEVENILALASAEHRLYVAVGEEIENKKLSISVSMSESNTDLSLYRSTDLGDSWQAIDFPKKTASDSEENAGFTFATGAGTRPVDDNSEMEKTASVKMVAAQERLLVVDGVESYYSSDAGETWISLGLGDVAIGSPSTPVYGGSYRKVLPPLSYRMRTHFTKVVVHWGFNARPMEAKHGIRLTQDW